MRQGPGNFHITEWVEMSAEAAAVAAATAGAGEGDGLALSPPGVAGGAAAAGGGTTNKKRKSLDGKWYIHIMLRS